MTPHVRDPQATRNAASRVCLHACGAPRLVASRDQFPRRTTGIFWSASTRTRPLSTHLRTRAWRARARARASSQPEYLRSTHLMGAKLGWPRTYLPSPKPGRRVTDRLRGGGARAAATMLSSSPARSPANASGRTWPESAFAAAAFAGPHGPSAGESAMRRLRFLLDVARFRRGRAVARGRRER